MNQKALFIIVFLLSLTSFAAPNTYILAGIQTTGGLVPNSYHQNLEIRSNGQVLLTQEGHPTKLIAVLSSQTLMNLKNTILKTQSLELVREKASGGDDEEPHRCLDAPTINWYVTQNLNQKSEVVSLQKIISCEKFVQKGPYAQELVQILDAFRILIQL